MTRCGVTGAVVALVAGCGVRAPIHDDSAASDVATPANEVGADDADGGDRLCADFAPCGGELVGAWMTNAACAPSYPTAPTSNCPGERFDLSGVHSFIGILFRADGTMQVEELAYGTAIIEAPDTCVVSTAGVPLSCTGNSVGSMWADRLDITGGQTGIGKCSDDQGVCRCSIPISQSPLADPFTYSVKGTTLTTTFDPGRTIDFCASSTVLKLHTLTRDRAATTLDVLDKLN
jgi:hypothetical protein